MITTLDHKAEWPESVWVLCRRSISGTLYLAPLDSELKSSTELAIVTIPSSEELKRRAND